MNDTMYVVTFVKYRVVRRKSSSIVTCQKSVKQPVDIETREPINWCFWLIVKRGQFEGRKRVNYRLH